MKKTTTTMTRNDQKFFPFSMCTLSINFCHELNCVKSCRSALKTKCKISL